MDSLLLRSWFRTSREIFIVGILSIVVFACDARGDTESFIKPYSDNPKYWQYKGEPVLLLGGTDDDNLFQMENLEAHLDELKASGGNFIRNTLSSRDSGNVWPFYQNAEGIYDLDAWGDEYWERIERLLKLCEERDIVVQIEVWDRFDFSRGMGADGAWDLNPFNPVNNINYTLEEVGFQEDYPQHPSTDVQPFFHTVPGMEMYHPRLDRVREYQEKLVKKLLSYSLEYGNVLYCMNNETSTPVEWGNYWIDFIRSKADAAGKEVYLTDMYDNFYRFGSCEKCREMVAQPEYYTFLDISQINSRNFGQAHWDTLQMILGERDRFALRPANHTKIYGGANRPWGSGSNEDGVERFCRNVMGGSALARHHRPPTGNGLNEYAKATIQATRKVEELVKFWEVEPKMHLLSDREPNEAYLSAREGSAYIVYFPKGGQVTLDLNGHGNEFAVNWINISTGEWGETGSLEGGGFREIVAAEGNGWYVVLTAK